MANAPVDLSYLKSVWVPPYFFFFFLGGGVWWELGAWHQDFEAYNSPGKSLDTTSLWETTNAPYLDSIRVLPIFWRRGMGMGQGA